MNLAAIEASDSTFLLYVIALGASGLIMLAVGALGIGTPSVGLRVLSSLLGLAFAGYAFYLAFIFEGGEYRLFWYAFIFPVLAIAQAVKTLTQKKAPAEQ
jgi:hypothetical protein